MEINHLLFSNNLSGLPAKKLKGIRFDFLWYPLCLGILILFACCGKNEKDQGAVTLKRDSHRLELENGRVRLVLALDSPVIIQTFFARDTDDWKQVASAVSGNEKQTDSVLPLYKKGLGAADAYRMMVNEGLHDVKVIDETKDSVRILLTGSLNQNTIEEILVLKRGSDFFHVEIGATLTKEPKLEYLLSSFLFSLPGTPDFAFVPSVKRADDDVIADRKFFAPAAIVEKDGFMMALVPDLNEINQHIVYAKGARPQRHPRVFAVPIDTNKISFPSALDLNLHSGISEQPLVSYGMMDFWVEQHLYWRHENGHQIRELSGNQLHYGFDLFLDANVEKTRGYQRISSFLWEKYGTHYFQMPRPQVMPFSDYAKLCYPASFAYQGYDVGKASDILHLFITQRKGHPELASWQEWTDHGVAMGALRLSAPQWYQFLYNTPWWNNACDATGIYFWGRKLKDSTLIDKARRIINFTLSAPQTGGIFPSLYDLNKKTWIKSLWTMPMDNYNPDSTATYFDWDHGSYQTAAASETAGFLLQYKNTCEDNPGILPYVRRYAEFLTEHIPQDGCVPGWFNDKLEALPSLKWNADGGAHIWVLSELYKITHEKKWLEGAEKIAHFMMDSVMPRQKWYDFETFYSCAVKPESFFDKYTGQYPANTMSVAWALEGFASLYEADQNKVWLAAAEACADYSIFYQAVWAPHFIITAYPFGGFSSQNSDGEWLDQRSSRFANGLVRIGLLSHRQDLVERGVASAKASLTLINSPLSIKNDVYKYPNYPLGLGPENIDHEGFPQMPLRSGPSWCEVGGLAAVAQVMNQLGSAYIDFQENIGVGVDGVSVVSQQLKDQKINITLKSLLAGLKVPYDKAFGIDLHITGLPAQNYQLILNDSPAQSLTAKELASLPVTIYPDGRIAVNK
jgi:hypothetical protein